MYLCDSHSLSGSIWLARMPSSQWFCTLVCSHCLSSLISWTNCTSDFHNIPNKCRCMRRLLACFFLRSSSDIGEDSISQTAMLVLYPISIRFMHLHTRTFASYPTTCTNTRSFGTIGRTKQPIESEENRASRFFPGSQAYALHFIECTIPITSARHISIQSESDRNEQ